MRALVGSDGSTGSVMGAKYAMLAKLRWASGIASISWDKTTVLITLLVESTGACTSTRVLLPEMSSAMTSVWGTAPESRTSMAASWKPNAVALTWYLPGGRQSIRYSPRLLLTIDRSSCDADDLRVMVAPGTRAPVTSLTMPTKELSGLWA